MHHHSLLLVLSRLHRLRRPLFSFTFVTSDRHFPQNRTPSDHAAHRSTRLIPIAPRRQPHLARAALKTTISRTRRESHHRPRNDYAVYRTFPPSRPVRIFFAPFSSPVVPWSTCFVCIAPAINRPASGLVETRQPWPVLPFSVRVLVRQPRPTSCSLIPTVCFLLFFSL